PIYISEITPASNRGKLVASYQFNIVFGILVAYISNYLIGAYVEIAAWRWMLGVEAVPAAIYSLFVLQVPESPRWLALRDNDEQGAREVLMRLNPKKNIERLFSDITASVRKASKDTFFSRKF